MSENYQDKVNETEKGLQISEKEVVNDTYEGFVKSFPEEKRRKVIRKIDIRLVPCLCALYLVSQLDRSNIGNAKILNLEADLGMSGVDYNIVTAVFFVPYILCEPVSNVILKRFFNDRPSWYVGGICTLWGTIMTLHGVVQNYPGLVAVRFFLGVSEAGFFPAAVLIISNWYMKFEMQTRISLFYFAATISGSVSGLLAYGIGKMDGVSGIAAWRWLFILEGLATVVVGVATFFLLPDVPENASWLNEDEVRYLRYRSTLQEGGTAVTENSKFSWPIFRSVLLDWKLYISGMIFWANTGPAYGIKFTLPQIIKSMGYTAANAQLLTIPPYAIGGICAISIAKISDKYKWRMPFISGPLMVSMIGFAVMTVYAGDIKNNIGAAYTSVCLMTAGYYPIAPAINAWAVNNLAGPVKRSFGVGYFVAIGNLGGIAGSFMYVNKEAPGYPTGFGLSLAFIVWGALLAVVLDLILWKLNERKSKLSKEEVLALYTEEQLAALGDSSPLFKYTL